MKRLLLFFLMLALKASAQSVWTDHSRLLPDALRGIPTGIEVFHDPTPVYPEPNTDTVNYPGKYIWRHSTTVSAKLGLTVIPLVVLSGWAIKAGSPISNWIRPALPSGSNARAVKTSLTSKNFLKRN